MKTSDFFSRRMAESLVPDQAVPFISITDFGRPAALQHGWREVLSIEFNDLFHVDYNNPSPYRGPIFEDAAAILVFIRKHQGATRILVHCEAGHCRSAAVALLLDAMGWKLDDVNRAHAANPRLVCLLAEAWGHPIPLPRACAPAQKGRELLW